MPGQNAASEEMNGFTTRPEVMCTSTGHTIPPTASDNAECARFDEYRSTNISKYSLSPNIRYALSKYS